MGPPNPIDQTIVAEFFTTTARVRCTLRVHQRRLSDYLNDLDERFIVIDSPTIGSLADPGCPLQEPPFAQFNRDNIILAIPSAGEVLKDEEKRLVFVRKDPHRVTLSATPFLVQGELHLIKEARLRDALHYVRAPFFPVTNAEVRYLPTGQRFPADILIVQRGRIEMLCPASL